MKTCVLNYIYKMSPLERPRDKSIAKFRYEAGELLKNTLLVQRGGLINKIEAVVPCPQTGIYYAAGLANAINKPYLPAIYNNSLGKRFLDVVNPDDRKKAINQKLQPIKEFVQNKKIAIVDEAIFTGMTLKLLCETLREYEAKEIYILIPTPMCFSRCLNDSMPQKNILLENISPNMLKEYFDCDEIIFQDFDVFNTKIQETFSNTCLDCFRKGE